MNRTEHLLACLAEECAEVQHAVAKALRFGLDDGYPGAASTNAQDIARELIDLVAVVGMLEDEDVICVPSDPGAINRKKEKVRNFMDYAESVGALTPNVELTGDPQLHRGASSGTKWSEVERRVRGYCAMGTIPNSYKPAEWRNTTPADSNTNRIGVGFDMSDGTVLRLSLSQKSARHLTETLQGHLTRPHSEISSGMPSVDVSNPPDGENV